MLIFLSVFAVSENSSAKRKNYYRTFEIIGIGEGRLILQDSDGNVIEVNRTTADYQVGYKVRYDSVRKRLRAYRWQDYEVAAISGQSITLQHKTGEIISLEGNYASKFNIGDQVRYDSVDKKLQREDNNGQWRQYTVVAAAGNQITLENNIGQQIILSMDNNLYPEQRNVYIGKYKVGDLVRYNATTNKLRKSVIRTYDWQDYVIKGATEDKIILLNEDGEEITLDNTFGKKFKTGEPVKYDRINNLLKKAR